MRNADIYSESFYLSLG